MDAKETLKEKLKLLPTDPGVYRYYSAQNKILYIGKAKNLKNRVRTYFNPAGLYDPRIENLVPLITDLDWIVTNTETEALILEEQLIKRHKPKFNIELKDDKTYPYFKITIKERFPRLFLTREIKKDGSIYFGPYVSVKVARAAEYVIRKNFPLRRSKMNLDGTRDYRPCLNYQMKQCFAPCANKISVEDYGQLVSKVIQLLKGNGQDLIKLLEEEMSLKSEAMLYEEAGALRDQMGAVEKTLQKQRVLSKHKIDRDVIALTRLGGFAGIQILFIRGGILLSDDFVFVKDGEMYNDTELLRSVLSRQYVKSGRPLPREIIVPESDESLTIIQEYCSQLRGTKVDLLVPQKGEKKELLKLAFKNAEQNIKLKMEEAQADDMILKEVQSYLHLRNLPNKVECFDISNISGTSNVGGMIVWEGNEPKKSEFRKYKIKSFEGANDFLAMQEVLIRRYSRMIEEDQTPPDLILIDGGKGQVSAAVEVLNELRLDFTKTDVIGLAKGRSEKRRGVIKEEDYEYVIRPGQKNPIPLKKNSKTLHFLQNIRDEVHRFAITFHRQVRGKETLKSVMESIDGIGPQKRKSLLKHFGSLSKVKTAKIEELEKVSGISQRDALEIVQFFSEDLTG